MTREQLKQLEADLWSAADNLRANSDLKSNEYSTPVLGLIFLKFADNNYRRHEAEIIAEYQKLKGTRREKKISEIAIEKCGFYDRIVFTEKCNNVFGLMVDYASQGVKWAM
jgi:type I restriction enzyme M protein